MATVVGLHAVGESGRSFDVLRPFLDLVAPDLRGHGDAPKPDTGYAVADFAADVAALLRETGPAVLAGASSGGLIAQRVAADHPELVAGLLLIGSPRTLQGRTPPPLGDVTDPAALRAFSAGLAHRPLCPEVLDLLTAEGLKAPPHVWEQTLAGLVAEPAPSDRGIGVPTVVVWGVEDRVLSRTEQEALAAAIPGARLQVLEGVGHLPLFEAPEAVADAYKTLLKSRL